MGQIYAKIMPAKSRAEMLQASLDQIRDTPVGQPAEIETLRLERIIPLLPKNPTQKSNS